MSSQFRITSLSRKRWRKFSSLRFGTFIKRLFIFGGVFGFLGVLFGISFLYSVLQDMPDVNNFHTIIFAESSVIYDRNGEELYTLHGDENRTLIPIEQIPENLIESTIAIEDDKFFEHQGFSVTGILQAVLSEFLSFGGHSRGGSTLTQQFVKNTFLTREKTYTRKLKEIILSLQLEWQFSKDKILEMYLNSIPYGSNAYGVEQASQTFFGKSVSEISLAESAILASLPQAPSFFSPYGDYKQSVIFLPEEEYIDFPVSSYDQFLEKLKPENMRLGLLPKKIVLKNDAEIMVPGRTSLVLRRMVDIGFISEEKRRETEEYLSSYQFKKNIVDIKAPHFVMYVRNLLEEKYGKEFLQAGGLKIYTTLDYSLQQEAEKTVLEQVKKNETQYSAKNASAMTVNPKTGEILTMVGSRNYFDTENDGNVNIMLSRRLAGSSFKPFAFASAFLNGYAPSTIVFDTETDFGNNYVPKNFDGKFRGPVSFRFALGNSLNIPAIKAGILGGIHSVHSLASKMGISFLKEADWYGSAISLGVAEVRPFDMAQAYSVFALGGKKKEFSPFLRILDKNNNVLFSKESLTSREERVLDEGIAYLVNDVLSDKEARGPGWNALLQIPGIVNASKTGTSNKNVQNTVLPLDGWTIGYTPEVLVVAWAGNNDGSPMNRNGSGYSTAGPIWNTLMKQALAKTEATEFIRPSSVNTALVSRLTGKLPGENFPRSLLTQGIFTSHNIPKTYDDSLEMIEVEKIHGDLPNEYTPESAKKQVFVVQWKSLRPNDENWQEPVESWAKEFSSSYLSSLGISGDILAQKPTKVTTLYTPKNTQSSLQLSFLSPAPFATVSAQGVDAVLSLKSSQGVSQVEFYLDTQKIKTLTSPPYRSFLSFPEGTKTGDAFTVKVIAYDALYNSKMITQDIVIGKDTKPPRVSFVSPQKDEVFEPFSQASFYIDAFDENGGISEVVWFLDGKTLGTKRQYPFSLSYLTSETEGEYTISVQVSDYAGNKTKQSQTFFVERKNSFSQSKTLEIRKVEKQNDDVSLEYSVNMEDALDISKVIVLARYRSSLGADIEDTILSELETISEKSTGIFSTLFRSPIAGEYEFFLRAVYKNGKVLFSPKVSFVVKEGR